jgi:hypothetical protein
MWRKKKAPGHGLEKLCSLAFAAFQLRAHPGEDCGADRRRACSFNVSTSRTPPAVADTRMRYASFFFTSEAHFWV